MLCAALSLAPYWSGYQRVWSDDDSWMHLKKVELLRNKGPLGLFQVLDVRELSAHDHPVHSGLPPLMQMAAAEASYLVGVLWAMRLTPIVVLLAATLALYQLGRTWSLAPANAALAAALSSSSFEMIRQEGMRFLPQGLGVLLGIWMIRSAYLAMHETPARTTRLVEVAAATALMVIGYGAHLFHFGAVIGAGLAVEWIILGRRVGEVVRIPVAMALGMIVASPFMFRVSYHPAHFYEYFVPIDAGGRLETLGEIIKYPVLIGPVLAVLVLVGLPRLAACCRARESWAIWLAVWLIVLLPQTIFWLFIVPGPPFRLLVTVLPALGIVGAIGLGEIGNRLRWTPRKTAVAGALAVLLTVSSTAALIAKLEISRRWIRDGEINMYRQASKLPAGATLYVAKNVIVWYFCGDRAADTRVEDASYVLAHHGSYGPDSYWLISDREWQQDPRLRPVYEQVLRAGKTVFDDEDSRIVQMPAGETY